MAYQRSQALVIQSQTQLSLENINNFTDTNLSENDTNSLTESEDNPNDYVIFD